MFPPFAADMFGKWSDTMQTLAKNGLLLECMWPLYIYVQHEFRYLRYVFTKPIRKL